LSRHLEGLAVVELFRPVQDLFDITVWIGDAGTSFAELFEQCCPQLQDKAKV
jgi:hypothetical protein